MYYDVEDSFLLRSPILSLNKYLDILTEDDWKLNLSNLYKNPFVKEAIFLASETLFDTLEKVIVEGSEPNENLKVWFSLLKYISRMSTRATPFGLFAGVTTGVFGQEHEIIIGHSYTHSKDVKLDFLIATKVLQHLSLDKKIIERISYFPNNSAYSFTNELRYIEWQIEDVKKKYSLQSVILNPDLKFVYENAKNGKTLDYLRKALISRGFELENVNTYLDYLIQNQLLTSGLTPYLVGKPLMETWQKVLEQKKLSDKSISYLKQINRTCDYLSSNVGIDITDYKKSAIQVSKNLVKGKIGNHFQVDLFLKTKECAVRQNTKSQIRRAVSCLVKISGRTRNSDLFEFKNRFRREYPYEKRRLVDLLDPEYGFGYPIGVSSSKHLYLNDLNIENSSENELVKPLTDFQKILLQKIWDSPNGRILEISDEDLNKMESIAKEDLPATASSLCEIIELKGDKFLFMPNVIGPTASRIIARFANGSKQINSLVKKFSDFEEEYWKDCICAEISHMPEQRTGNILLRPQTRTHEITFLVGTSPHTSMKRIGIEDLLLYIEKGKLALYSSSYKKRVIPFLTNAHNYKRSKLPIYRFLCDLQFETSQSLSFEWGSISEYYNTLPRVVYKDIILSKRVWFVENSEIKDAITASKNTKDQKQHFDNFIAKRKLPRFFQLKEGDNTLLIDANSIISMEMLINEVRNKENFQLVEFLQASSNLIKNENGKNHIGEFVFFLSQK